MGNPRGCNQHRHQPGCAHAGAPGLDGVPPLRLVPNTAGAVTPPEETDLSEAMARAEVDGAEWRLIMETVLDPLTRQLLMVGHPGLWRRYGFDHSEHFEARFGSVDELNALVLPLGVSQPPALNAAAGVVDEIVVLPVPGQVWNPRQGLVMRWRRGGDRGAQRGYQHFLAGWLSGLFAAIDELLQAGPSQEAL